MYYLIFFFVLVIVSGFIAYLGDYIGRYLGKKRLTLFGLRPKHTAIVSTVITGMLISLLVLAVLTGINSQFRQVLVHGQTILKNNKRLSTESREMSSNNKLLSVSNKELLKEQERLVKETKIFLSKYDKARADLDRARKAKETAENARNKALENIKILREDVNKKQKELKVLQDRDKGTRSALKAKEQELGRVQEDLDDARQGLIIVQNELKDSTSKLEEVKSQLANATLQLGQAQQELARTKRELDATKEELTVTLKDYTYLRLSDVVLNQNDEISRKVISGNKDIRGIETDLMSLFYDTNRVCYDVINKSLGDSHFRGSSYDPGKFYATLTVRDENDNVYRGKLKDVIEKLAQIIKDNSETNSLVITTCSTNTTLQDLEKDEVFVEFKPYENKLIYPKGTVIASKIFDGRNEADAAGDSSSREEVNEISKRDVMTFTAIYYFFNNTLYKDMVEKGIVPIRTSSLVVDNQEEVQKQIEMYLILMRTIKEENSFCLVNLVATKDIYVADTINLQNSRFEVDKIK